MGNVKTGVRSFVKAFEGTPTRLQIITFDYHVGHPRQRPAAWNKFFDLADPADVDTLIGPTGTAGSGEHDRPATVAPTGRTRSTGRSTRATARPTTQLAQPERPDARARRVLHRRRPDLRPSVSRGSDTGTTVRSDASSAVDPRFHPVFRPTTPRQRATATTSAHAGGTGPTTSSTSSATTIPPDRRRGRRCVRRAPP